MRATFLSTEGAYLEAKVSIDGVEYSIMDEITIDEKSSPRVGDDFEIELQTLLADESWDEIFSSNPEKRIGLKNIEGWKYRAFGKVTGINPVTVDCGLYIEEDVFHSNDPKVIGQYVSFTIQRLGAYGYAI